MRVIAGKWRGRVLQAPKGDRVRPTTDRVKEAMFSILGPSLQGATLLDLCCGTGGLGIEALSRGARQVLLVDSSRRSLEAARRNLEVCGAEPGSHQLICEDCLGWLARWAPPREACFLVADPPYAGDLPERLMAMIMARAAQGHLRVAVLEHRADLDRPDAPCDLAVQARRYGQSHLTIIRSPRPAGGQDEEEQ